MMSSIKLLFLFTSYFSFNQLSVLISLVDFFVHAHDILINFFVVQCYSPSKTVQCYYRFS